MNDYKEMWCEAYDFIKQVRPNWTEEQLAKAATNRMSNQISNIIDANKND